MFAFIPASAGRVLPAEAKLERQRPLVFVPGLLLTDCLSRQIRARTSRIGKKSKEKCGRDFLFLTSPARIHIYIAERKTRGVVSPGTLLTAFELIHPRAHTHCTVSKQPPALRFITRPPHNWRTVKVILLAGWHPSKLVLRAQQSEQMIGSAPAEIAFLFNYKRVLEKLIKLMR
jgi:hypothetical protein